MTLGTAPARWLLDAEVLAMLYLGPSTYDTVAQLPRSQDQTPDM